MYNNMTAENFAISSDIVNNYNDIATSDNLVNQAGNINVLNSLLTLRHCTTMFSEGAPEDFMNSVITTMAIDAEQADRIYKIENALVQQIDKNRQSISGVSEDEEMANMVKYQHAYNASAKLVNTMSEILDTLINKVGVN